MSPGALLCICPEGCGRDAPRRFASGSHRPQGDHTASRGFRLPSGLMDTFPRMDVPHLWASSGILLTFLSNVLSFVCIFRKGLSVLYLGRENTFGN